MFQLWLITEHILSYPDATTKGRKNLKRPNPFISEAREGVEKGSSSRLPGSQGNATSGTRLLPHNHVEPKVSEAEAFLQDMSDSFRPQKMLKVEPVDVSLPPAAPRSVPTVRFPLPIL